MSFAAFILKLEADAKGVEKGVNVAQNHFKRLARTVRDIEKRREDQVKKETRMAMERLKPEEKLNSLLRTREQIAHRLARVEDQRIRGNYLQKQLETEKQITAIRASQATAARASLFSRAGRIAGVAAIGGGIVGAGVNKGASLANELTDLQLTTGFSLEGLQKLRFGAGATGTSFQGLISAATNLRSAQSAALNGNEKQIKSFGQAGIGIGDIRKLTTEELFFKLSNGGANIGNASALQKLFGEGSSQEVIKAFGNGLSRAASLLDRFGSSTESTIQTLSGLKSGIQLVTASAVQFARWVTTGFASGVTGLGYLAKATFQYPFSREAASNTLAKRELMFDDDYSASLAESSRLQQKLELSKERREGNDADRDAASQEDAEGWFRWYHANKNTRSSHVGTMGSGNHIDTDQLAKIGLYRGGTAPVERILSDHTRELQRINRTLERIEAESDD